MKRRQFIEKIARHGLFVSLAALTGFLFFKEETDEICDLEFVCKNCKWNKECNLDEAKKYRQKL